MERTLCNRCGDNTHSSEKCCWLSTPCCIRKCRGSRILKQSSQIQSLGKKFLTVRCGDFQWLEGESIVISTSRESRICDGVELAGVRKVNTTMKKTENEGRKFLNCTECGKDFEWLDTLLAWLRSNIELAASSSSSTITSSSSQKKDKKSKLHLKLTTMMDDSILIDEVGEKEEYGSVPESFAAPSAAPSVAFSSSVQPPEFEVEVEIVKPPCLGMCFETLEAAKQFYIAYGKSFGFSPVIRSSEKSVSRSDEVSSCQMTCSRFGVYRDRGGKNKNVDGTEKERGEAAAMRRAKARMGRRTKRGHK
ncbi:hypothetical protein IFM89_026346 [Coptis chinensis]|uniref:Uncharacterized protein n=1 Tax=Coptis chinensis TaxID=261450 RepID=A0A835LWR1_9MAGN|nr:hypothetical protein IFM89_026346 [Coptis chinensis]